MPSKHHRSSKQQGPDTPYDAELLLVPGIGEKTAANLYYQYGIRTLEELNSALFSGKMVGKSGFSYDKVLRMKRDLTVLLERRKALPIALAWPIGKQIEETLQSLPGVERACITGDLRRFVSMVRRIELLVAITDQTQFEAACNDWRIDPADTKGSYWLQFETTHDTYRVLVYTVTPDLFVPAWMRTTGDEVHTEVIQGLLDRSGYRWTPDDQIIEIANPSVVHVQSEEEIYELVGLTYRPPELREGDGILVEPKALVTPPSIRGDLHVHSTWSDGSQTIPEIVEMAERLHYEYIAITDHSQSLTVANGLTPERLRQQRIEIDEVQKRTKVHILHGTEVDILRGGELDFPDEVLSRLDVVIASVHSAMHLSRQAMTERLLRAIRHPAVHIIAHPTGRKIGLRSAYDVQLSALLEAAKANDVVLELNANPNRLDLPETALRMAMEQDIWTAIDTDAHHPNEFAYMAYGIRMAKRGWVRQERVLNTLSYQDLMRRLQKPQSASDPT